MAKRFQCELCRARSAEPGLCGRCGGELLDPEHPDDRRYIEALQAINPSVFNRIWRWLSEDKALMISTIAVLAMALNLELIGELVFILEGSSLLCIGFNVLVAGLWLAMVVTKLHSVRERLRTTDTAPEPLESTETGAAAQRSVRPKERTPLS